jgi:hypothetical protein
VKFILLSGKSLVYTVPNATTLAELVDRLEAEGHIADTDIALMPLVGAKISQDEFGATLEDKQMTGRVGFRVIAA